MQHRKHSHRRLSATANKRLCGVYLNRGRLITTIFFVPLASIPLIFGEKVLLALGQDPDVAEKTQVLLWYQMPAIFFYGHYDLYMRWLACMRITTVPLVAMIVATLLHLSLCFVFVNFLDLGINGLGLATSIKDFALILTVMIYANCSSEVKPALSALPWDRESFEGWGEYLKISLPSVIQIGAEWWAFEIIEIMAGNLGVEEQAAQTVIYIVFTTLSMVSVGFSESTGAIIGNCMGANNVPLAKRFFSLTTKASFSTFVILSTLLVSFRGQVVRFYTMDEQLHDLIMPVLALVALSIQFYGFQN